VVSTPLAALGNNKNTLPQHALGPESRGGDSSSAPLSSQARARAAAQGFLATVCSTATVAIASVGAVDEPLLTRADVGFINLNETLPEVTNVCWLDVSVGETEPQRIEVSLFGTVTPQTAANFKSLALGTPGYGYKGSDIFRVISTFSVQGGNIGVDGSPQSDAPQSQLGKQGKSAVNGGEGGFQQENFKILHGFRDAGVVSMMKDVVTRAQDSRFFITTSPDASWADQRYVSFGLVTKCMYFVRGLQILPTTPPTNFPTTRVRIVDSGCY